MIPPSFDHVRSMSDSIGMFEHADQRTPRREHGYCTDDMARLLIVTVRQPDAGAGVRDLRRLAFRFLAAAQSSTGRVRNRRQVDGRWTDRHGVDDCWGRSLWALGTAAHHARGSWLGDSALSCFNRSAGQRSVHRRAMAFAALGAAEVVAVDGAHRRARALLADAVDSIGAIPEDRAWPWPEPRLTYANAAIPEALIAAGDALGRPEVVADGLRVLAWLLDRQTVAGHLSPVPATGAGPTDGPKRFDQQPIEVAALADACARAWEVTGDEAWRHGVGLAIAWFEGANDLGVAMYEDRTGGGYDGLTPSGPNTNQGAESTLAMISTFQHADTFGRSFTTHASAGG